MSEESPVGYHIGNVGAGAQVAQGTNITQTMLQAGVAPDELREVFTPVFRAIDTARDLDEDEKAVASEAAQEVVEATERAQEDPSALKRALTKARRLLGDAWEHLASAMNSETVQKTIETITEAAILASIKSLTGA